ncbi:MAG: nitroreductase family protein [Clostridium celatum]|nr:nitroreductase family protein [Clostridium celatum]
MVNDFIFNESIDEIIKKRKSIRTYTNEEVSQEIIKNLNTYIKNLKSPFNESVTFEIIDSKEHINGSKIGTYGIIKGATKFIVVKVKKSEFSLQDLGYKMESLILYATSLGLGTCWIGGTFKKEQFAKAIDLKGDEILPIVSPIGYEASKKSLVDRTMRKFTKCDFRKPWNELFFLRDFSLPLTTYSTVGEYKNVFENVRLAPSALNKQPWRIIKNGDNFHFFIKKDKEPSEKINYDIQKIDMGIAMCHFDLSCKEKGINGGFKFEKPIIDDIPKNTKYMVSWIRE